MRASRFLPIAVASGLLASPSARSQAPPTFGVSAELVVIDLIATDADGRPITDLAAHEIELHEGSRRQRLDFVRFMTARPGAAVAIPDPIALSAEAPAAGAASAPVGLGLSLVVVVDLASIPFEALARTREAVAKLLQAGFEPRARLMLVTLEHGLQVRLPFTDDVEQFTRTMNELRWGQTSDGSLDRLVDDVRTSCSAPNGRPAAIALGRAWVEGARTDMTLSLNGLAALARQLALLPGRKQVVLLSAGYSTDPGAIAADLVSQLCGGGLADARVSLLAGHVEASRLVPQLIDEANRSQVSVYTVDVRGLMSDMPPASWGGAGGAGFQAVIRRIQREGKDTLSSIADGTGASAFVNTNDPAAALRAAATDARGYYLLGYAAPEGREEGRFYRVTVKVARPGARLRFRRGYEWLNEEKRSERAIAGAFLFPGLYSGDGLAVDSHVDGGRLKAAVMLPTRALVFRSEAGGYRNALVLQGLLRDDNGRAVGDNYIFTKRVDMNLSETRYADLRSRDSVEIASDAKAPKPGRYQLAVVLRHSGGRLASAATDVIVP